MKILETSRDFSAKEIYNMTQDKAVISVKNVPTNSILHVNGYVVFEDTNKDGDTSEILSIIGANDNGEVEVWACQSATFKRSFMDIVEIIKQSGMNLDDGVDIQKLDKEISKILAPNKRLLEVVTTETVEAYYRMTESDFIEHATIVPQKETEND